MKYKFIQDMRLSDGDVLYRTGDIKELPSGFAQRLLNRKMIEKYENKAIQNVENKSQG